jgi:hypothetical protein
MAGTVALPRIRLNIRQRTHARVVAENEPATPLQRPSLNGYQPKPSFDTGGYAMNIRRWLTLLEALSQAAIAVNLGMALQRLDDGHASLFTVVAISVSIAGLALIVIAQTRQRLATFKNGDHAGSGP